MNRNNWAAQFDEETRWEIYRETTKLPDWLAAVRWLEEKHGVCIGKSAYYSFCAAMRQEEAEERIARLRARCTEAEGITKGAKISNADMAEALKCLAIDCALEGDSAQSMRYATAATALMDREQKGKELELKEARQKTAEESLKLAREKFEFDAAKAAMAKAAEIKTISADAELAEDEKIARVREALFGVRS